MADTGRLAATKGLSQVQAGPRLAHVITNDLRQAILSGIFAQDEKLGLDNLAAQLGVSNMPVREALIALEREGLVLRSPRRGFRANPLSEQDLRDLYELHAHIAGILAARAALVISDEELAHLRSIHDRFVEESQQQDQPGQSGVLEELNVEFHRTIHKIPDGERLRWFMRLTSRYFRQDAYAELPGWVEATLADHPKILAALEAHDADLARTIAEDHFAQGWHLTPHTE